MTSSAVPVNGIHALPARAGPRPRTIPCAPHSQIDQIVPEAHALALALIERVGGLAHVELGGSLRAPPGTVGLHLQPSACCGSARTFLLGREFAHVHLEDDCSLHAILPEPLRSAAIEAGWAEAHPLAGQPTVSPDTVMLYAPRDAAEIEILVQLVEASWRNAQGLPF
ncbi:MAG: hypothetical protein KF730_03310 [Sphingomonas sp.]|uniref:luciferase domain-containing protein n=1 Tax=Sphingomonas sp. TaxID=28214 RepID=UPI0025F3CABE|nr:luciferase family protein [Sphingomonas sp.]MBX3563586.1 hypothetical protein [Sphingomonas sp.]